MKFQLSLTDLPKDKIVNITTSLEMFERPQSNPALGEQNWQLKFVSEPDIDWYQDLYRRIGENWLWFSRLMMADDELRSILHDPLVEVRALEIEGKAEGLLELDYRVEGECEIAFFGLPREITGKGAGRWLMDQALQLAWSKPIGRLWVHTCTLDHPSALPFYVRSGFTPYRRELEISDDPRLCGTLSKDSAPHFPLID